MHNQGLSEYQITLVRQVLVAVRPVIMQSFRHGVEFTTKADGSVVTRVDREIEAYLIDHLVRIIPHAGVVSEELDATHDGAQKEWCWIIDPLDGTTNFACGIAYFSVSVALMHCGAVVYGAVYDPITDELFDAQLGCGAWLQEVKITSKVMDVEGAVGGLVSVGLAYVPMDVRERCLQKVAGICSVRYCGSVALDLAYVAAGRLRGCFFENIRLWDGVAALLIINEVGGLVATNFSLEPFAWSKRSSDSCIAGDKQIYALLKSIV